MNHQNIFPIKNNWVNFNNLMWGRWSVWMETVKRFLFILNILINWQCLKWKTLRKILHFFKISLQIMAIETHPLNKNTTWKLDKALQKSQKNKESIWTVCHENQIDTSKKKNNQQFLNSKKINWTGWLTVEQNPEEDGEKWAVSTQISPNKLSNC